MIDRDEFSAWLRLLETPGVGCEAGRGALLARFGSPRGGARRVERRAQGDRRAGRAAALAQVPEQFETAAPQPAGRIGRTSGEEARDVVALGDPRYPADLLASADPPLLLYARGRIELLERAAIAIVGSRNATAQGLENARAFAAHLGGAGWVVVSGLALGIDGAAHEGALAGGSGTIAVVGTGLDVVYPLRHRALAHRIAAAGLAGAASVAVGTPALAENFPIRNRIIAGARRAARWCVDAPPCRPGLPDHRPRSPFEAGFSRDVFAIPGSIHSPQSRGCHALIKQGAKLVDSASDIVATELPKASRGRGRARAVPASRAAAERRPTSPIAADVLSAKDPILDALRLRSGSALDAPDRARTGQSAAELSARLLDFELQGRVARLPGQRFQRVERGWI